MVATPAMQTGATIARTLEGTELAAFTAPRDRRGRRQRRMRTPGSDGEQSALRSFVSPSHPVQQGVTRRP